MKRHVTIGIFTIIICGSALGQNVTYSYDNRGNVTKRRVTPVQNVAKKTKKTTKLDLSNDIQNCFNVGPNPTKGPLSIKCSNDISFGCYLYNEKGQLLDRKESVKNETQMDLAGYPTGVYLQTIKQNDSNRQYKIVKR